MFSFSWSLSKTQSPFVYFCLLCYKLTDDKTCLSKDLQFFNTIFFSFCHTSSTSFRPLFLFPWCFRCLQFLSDFILQSPTLFWFLSLSSVNIPVQPLSTPTSTTVSTPYSPLHIELLLSLSMLFAYLYVK